MRRNPTLAAALTFGVAVLMGATVGFVVWRRAMHEYRVFEQASGTPFFLDSLGE